MRGAPLTRALAALALGCGSAASSPSTDAGPPPPKAQCTRFTGTLSFGPNTTVAAAAGPDGKIYLAYQAYDPSRGLPLAVSKYDVETDTYTPVAPLDLGNATFTMTGSSAALYVLATAGASSRLLAYDAAGDRWVPKAGFAPAIQSHQLAPVHGKIYATGSIGTFNGPNMLFVYDEALDTWTRLANAPPGMTAPFWGFFTGVASNDALYTFGLDHNDDVYDWNRDAWGPAPPPPTERSANGLVFDGAHTIYSIGGSGYCNGATDTTGCNGAMDAFDTDTHTWSRAPDLPVTATTPLATLGCDGLIYVFGSASTAGRTPYPLRFDPATQAWLSVP